MIYLITTYFLKCIGEEIYKHQEDCCIPRDYYLGLSSTAPSIDGSGVTEPVSGRGYSRAEIPNNDLTFAEITTGNSVSNKETIYLPESTGSWGVMTHYVIFDEPTGGNLLMYGALSPNVAIPTRTIISIPAGSLSISVDNA